MRTVAIVQARTDSTRLPGKVLRDLGGRTVLARVVRRVRRARLVDVVVVATTEGPGDDRIVAECDDLGVAVFRGSEEDVLDRYYRAARRRGAEAVVRVTSDCPLIDPAVVDRVIGAFISEHPDFAANDLVATFPRGLDTEVLSFEALERSWREATESYERVHVTPYVRRRPDRFRLLSITAADDHSAHRWTVDTREDLELVRAIYARLGNGDDFGWRQALAVVEGEPELAEINRGVRQKDLEEG